MTRLQEVTGLGKSRINAVPFRLESAFIEG